MAKADPVDFTHGLPQDTPFFSDGASRWPPNSGSAAAALGTSMPEQDAAATLVHNLSANFVAGTLGDEQTPQLCPTVQLRSLLQMPESKGAVVQPTMPDSPTNLQVQYSTNHHFG